MAGGAPACLQHSRGAVVLQWLLAESRSGISQPGAAPTGRGRPGRPPPRSAAAGDGVGVCPAPPGRHDLHHPGVQAAKGDPGAVHARSGRTWTPSAWLITSALAQVSAGQARSSTVRSARNTSSRPVERVRSGSPVPVVSLPARGRPPAGPALRSSGGVVTSRTTSGLTFAAREADPQLSALGPCGGLASPQLRPRARPRGQQQAE
jgi:hypothetical protein